MFFKVQVDNALADACTSCSGELNLEKYLLASKTVSIFSISVYAVSVLALDKIFPAFSYNLIYFPAYVHQMSQFAVENEGPITDIHKILTSNITPWKSEPKLK